MNRRSFIRAVLGGVAALGSALGLVMGGRPKTRPAPPLGRRTAPDNRLTVRVLSPAKDSFQTLPALVFAKGGHHAVCQTDGLTDVIDCHGLDATTELTDLFVHQLEYGPPLRLIERDGYCSQFEYGPRRVKITKSERLQMWITFRTLRNGKSLAEALERGCWDQDQLVGPAPVA